MQLEPNSNRETTRASEDLTIVFFKGNGSPRSFRVSVPALQRSLTFFGFFLAIAVLGSLTLIGVSLFPRSSTTQQSGTTSSGVSNSGASDASSTATGSPMVSDSGATAPNERSSSVWDQLKGSMSASRNSSDDSELKKEVDGLREDIAKLNSELDQRKELPLNNPSPLLAFFGPRSTMIAEADSLMRVRNANEVRDASSRQIYLDFELHNVDPQQRQVKGYIVVLAKTTEALVSYPANAFAPSQNIFLDFTRGETFAVSRFRQARANFPTPLLDTAKKIYYQILIFGTDGKLLSNVNVEGGR